MLNLFKWMSRESTMIRKESTYNTKFKKNLDFDLILHIDSWENELSFFVL